MVSPLPRRSAPFSVFVLAAVVVFGFQVHRAATVCVTHDEAITWLRWASHDWSQLHQDYTANNHILNTALVKVCADLFGTSTLTLRLPALAAFAGFLVVLGALLRWLGAAAANGGGWRLALPALAIVFNPMLLEMFACSRGYALALAFQAAMGYAMLRSWQRPKNSWGTVAVGGLAGLVIASNAAFATAVFAMLAVYGWGKIRRRRHGTALWRALLALGLGLALPAAAILFPVLGPVLHKLGGNVLYFGVPTLLDSFRGVASLWGTHSFADIYALPAEGSAAWGHSVSVPAIAVAVIGSAVGSGWIGIRFRGSSVAAATAGAGFALVLGLVLAQMLWSALNVPLPHLRTATCFVLLVQMAWLGLAVGPSGPWRWLAQGLSAVLLALGLTAFPADYYGEWHHDKNAEATYRALAQWQREDRPLRVLSHPIQYNAAVDYYRAIDGGTWLDPIDRDLIPGKEYDFAIVQDLVLSDPVLGPFLGEVVYRDLETHVVIARFAGVR